MIDEKLLTEVWEDLENSDKPILKTGFEDIDTIMGLTDGIYFLSYFIQYIILSIIDSFIISLICLLVFTKIPFIVLYLMFFLYSLNVFALAFCFQSFIEKTKESLILSLIIYFSMFFFHVVGMSENQS